MRAAFELAEESFLASLPFDVIPSTTSNTGVEFDAVLGLSRLHLNESNPMAAELHKNVKDWTLAWLLVLGHESGHLRLNAACLANGDDPRDADAQLRAMGIDSSQGVTSSPADFQKETAIEAYCDICLAKVASDALGKEWRGPVEALRDQRTRDSDLVGLLKGDGYATSPALDEFLRRDGALDPAEAARIALAESMRRTSAFKKAVVAKTENAQSRLGNMSEAISKWRGRRSAEDGFKDSGGGPRNP